MQKCEEEQEDEGFGRERERERWEEIFDRMHSGWRNGGMDGLGKRNCVWTEPHVLQF